jgi:hypothetical protein
MVSQRIVDGLEIVDSLNEASCEAGGAESYRDGLC